MTFVPQLALLGVTVIWGWTFVAIKESLEAVGPLAFLFYRFALATGLVALGARRLCRAPWRVWLQGVWIGLALFAGYGFQTWGLRYTSATHSGFITGLSVVFVPLLAVLAFGQRVRAQAWVGVGLSVLGLALIVFGAGSTDGGINLGDGLTLLCAISFALHILLVGTFARPGTYAVLLVVQLGTVAALSGLGMLALERTLWPPAVAWPDIVLTAVLATALALWVQNRFQPLVSTSQAAIILASEPVFAGLFGFWLLGERLVGSQWLGAGLILIAMLVAYRRAS